MYGMAKNLEVLVCATISGSGSVRMRMDIAYRSRRLISLLSRFVFSAISSNETWPPDGIMSRILKRTIESMLTTFATYRTLVSGPPTEPKRSLPRQTCKSASEVPREPRGAQRLRPTDHPEGDGHQKGGLEGYSRQTMEITHPGLTKMLAALRPRCSSLQLVRRFGEWRRLVPL